MIKITAYPFEKAMSDHKAFQIDIKLPEERLHLKDKRLKIPDKEEMSKNSRVVLKGLCRERNLEDIHEIFKKQ